MLRTALAELLGRLRKKTAGYWLRLLVTIFAVEYLVAWMNRVTPLTEYREWYYYHLEKTSPIKATDRNTVIVFINDEEYWKGELDQRVPIKRDYLARLVERLDAADAAVIALDFDLRSPVPDGNPRESPDYTEETKKLLETVKAVSLRRPVVLPKTVWSEDGEYTLDSDIYDGFDFGQGMVFKGYIALPWERLRMPVTLKAKGIALDSFSMAIARAFRPRALSTLPKGDDLPYGGFLPVEEFDQLNVHEVLTGDPLQVRRALKCRVVIVGGAWSRLAYGRGPSIDSHPTPVGSMPGAYLNANYVEDILDGKVYPPMGETAVWATKWLLIATMAMAFAIAQTRSARLLVVSFIWVLLLVLSYFLFISLGIIFDFFVLALSVTTHWVLEPVWVALQRYVRPHMEALIKSSVP